MQLKNIFNKSVKHIRSFFSKCVLHYRFFDVIAIVIGLVTLILNLVYPNCDTVIWATIIASVLGLYYSFCPFFLYNRKRVEFDWHLIYGHSLEKVCALVVLMPSVITSLFMIHNSCVEDDISPKDIIFEENLYKQSNTLVKLSPDVSTDSLWHQIHGSELKDGGVLISQSNLPETIRKKQVDPPLYWSVYFHFIDPGNQHMTTSREGRIFAALAAILGVFLLNGLLVSSIIGWIDRRKGKVHSGEVDYKLCHLGKYKFAVVIGANEIASSVIRNLLSEHNENSLNFKNEGNNKYVLLQTSNDVSKVRDGLASHLTDEELKKVVFYKGQRDSDDDLKKLYPEYATEIYVLGEYSLLDGGESFHDAMNMRCVNLLAKLIQEGKNKRIYLFFGHKIKKLLGQCSQLDCGENSQNEMNGQCDNLLVEFKQAKKNKKICFFFESKIKKLLGQCSLLDRRVSLLDEKNMRCVKRLAELIQTEEYKELSLSLEIKRRVCKVLFEYQTTQSVFHFSDITSEVKDNLVFLPFNRYESWARTVIVENKAPQDIELSASYPKKKMEMIDYLPLDALDEEDKHSSSDDVASAKNTIEFKLKNIQEDDSHVHFVVVGMSKMGVAMGLQAMLQAHYVNYAQAETIEDKAERIKKKNMRRTRITFIDTNMDKEKNFFMGRYVNMFNLTRYRYFDANEYDYHEDIEWIDPIQQTDHYVHLCRGGESENFIDIEVEFIKGELESDGIRRYLESISDKDGGNEWVKNSKLTIAICFPKTHEAVAASLYMPISVYHMAKQIWVYQREAADIILNLKNTGRNDVRYKKLRPFGMIYGEFMCDRSLYLKALLVNGAYNLKDKDFNDLDEIDMCKKETYLDLRTSWKRLTLDKRLSNKYFADSIYQKLRGILTNASYKSVINYSNEALVELREILKPYVEDDNKNKDKSAKTTSNEEDITHKLGKSILGICEHNRWNVEQLMFGYAPSPKTDDKRLNKLDKCRKSKDYDLDELKNQKLSCEEVIKKAIETHKADKSKSIIKEIYNGEKDLLKQGILRMHPNVCEFNHLDDIDFEAKNYDIVLNGIIPHILKLVDKKVYDSHKTTKEDKAG